MLFFAHKEEERVHFFVQGEEEQNYFLRYIYLRKFLDLFYCKKKYKSIEISKFSAFFPFVTSKIYHIIDIRIT